MGATVGNLLVRVSGDLSGFTAAIRDMEKQAKETTARVKQAFDDLASTGTKLMASITLPLFGVGVAALKTAGDLEQNSIAFKTMLGSAEAAQKHLEELRQFALKTPFQFNDLVIASKRMQAYGFAAKDTLPMLRSVGDAAAALGMGSEGINRVITALGQMKAKGMVQAEEMRQLAEAGIPAWQILAKTLNTDVAGAMKQVEDRTVSAAVAVPAILAGMSGRFGGLMEQQSKMLLGMWSNFKDSITFTLMDIGTVLTPFAKKLMEGFLQPMLDGLKDLARKFAELPDAAKMSILGVAGLAALLGPALFMFGQLGLAINGVATAMKALAALNVVGAFTNITYALSAGLVGALTMAEKAMLGLGVAAIAAAAAFAGFKLAEWVASIPNLPPWVEKILNYAWDGWIAANKQAAAAAAQNAAAQEVLASRLKAQGIVIEKTGRTSQEYGDRLRYAALHAAEIKAAMEKLHLPAERVITLMMSGAMAAQEFGDKSVASAAKVTEATRYMTMAEILQAEAHKQNAAGFQAVIKAVLDMYNAGQPWGKQLELQHAELNKLETAAYQWANALQVAHDKIKALSVEDVGITIKRPAIVDVVLDPNSSAGLRRAANAAGDYYDKMVALRKQGQATDADVQRAYDAWTEAEKRAAGVTVDHTKKTSDLGREVRKAYDHMRQGVAEAIVEWKGFGETALNVVKELAKGIIEILIGRALKKLAGSLTGVLGQLGGIGKAIGGLFDSGGKSSAGKGVTDYVGDWTGGGGSAAGGGLPGIFDSITGVISAGASVVSAIWNVRQEGTLNAIEKNTRELNINFFNALRDTFQAHIPVIRDLQLFNMSYLLPTLREIRDAVANAISVKVNLNASDEDAKKFMDALTTRVTTVDYTTGDRLLDLNANLLRLTAAAQDGFTKLTDALNNGIQLIVGQLRGLQKSTLEKILQYTGIGQIGAISSGLGGLAGGIANLGSGLLGGIGGLFGDRKEGSLNAIEHNTRYAEIHTLGILEKLNAYIPALSAINGFLWEAQGSANAAIVFQLEELNRKGGAARATFEFNDCDFGGATQDALDNMMNVAFMKAAAAGRPIG